MALGQVGSFQTGRPMAPRRIVTFNWTTADGYFAGTDGNLDWVVPDAGQAKARYSSPGA